MKRIATVQDISCLGKCSLTVALPIISAMGIETAVLPTAVLSTHTAFQNFTFRDLTEDIPKVTTHWKTLNLQFSALYTGYLGSLEQIEHVENIIRSFAQQDTMVIVDPVMGDNGKLYAGFTEKFADEMAKLCKMADVVVPNMTEACALLHIPYVETYGMDMVKDVLKRLTDLGAKQAVLTGVVFSANEVGAMAYDREKDEYYAYKRERISKNFHGTGDVFASTLTGALTRGLSLYEAMQLAVDFTVLSIQKTIEDPTAVWYGVNFEQALPMLIERLS